MCDQEALSVFAHMRKVNEVCVIGFLCYLTMTPKALTQLPVFFSVTVLTF